MIELRSIKYVSRSMVNGDLGAITALQKQCLASNKQHAVTGALYYDGQIFFQILEGDTATIGQLLENIQTDNRHTEFQVVSDMLVDHRLFEEWHMKFVAGELSPGIAANFSYTGMRAATQTEIAQRANDLRFA